MWYKVKNALYYKGSFLANVVQVSLKFLYHIVLQYDHVVHP